MHVFPQAKPLTIACVKGLSDVVQLLLRDPRCTGLNKYIDYYEATVLILAASCKSMGNARVCKMIINDPRFELIDATCAQYGCLGRDGGSAYDFAKQAGLACVADLLDSINRKKERTERTKERMGTASQGCDFPQRVPGMFLSEDASSNKVVRAAGEPNVCAASVSSMLAVEKDFLKAIKEFRAIQKLEEKRAKGERLDQLQEKKLDKKKEALSEMQGTFMQLPETSDLPHKNPDIVALLQQSSMTV